MKRNTPDDRGSTAVGYLIATIGFLTTIFFFAAGNLPFVDQILVDTLGLAVLDGRFGTMTLLGIVLAVIGAGIVFLDDVDIDDVE